MLRAALLIAFLSAPASAGFPAYPFGGERGEEQRAFGHIHISTDTSAETTISNNTVFVKVAGTCVTTSEENMLFVHSTNCRLTYTGVKDRDFAVNVHFTVTKEAGSASIGYFRIAKNGDAEEQDSFETQIFRALANTADAGAAGIVRTITLSKDDYIEFWITTANANNLTVATMSLVIQER